MNELLPVKPRRRTRIGLVAGGLGAYWPQFPGLLPQLQESARYVSHRDPLLRGLGVYHGKRGWGVSVEFDVQHGPVTLLGLGQDRGGSLSFIASEGTVVPGPLLAIGNTTSRVSFDRDPGEWVDDWSATGVGHHWSLSIGHRAADYKAAASLLGIDFSQV